MDIYLIKVNNMWIYDCLKEKFEDNKEVKRIGKSKITKGSRESVNLR